MTKAFFRVHFWHGGRDKGPISCQLESFEAAERWVSDWKAVGEKYESDDLRIHDSRSAGHIGDCEAA